jgi:hypothetical protein
LQMMAVNVLDHRLGKAGRRLSNLPRAVACDRRLAC